jgi:hypothetical protein
MQKTLDDKIRDQFSNISSVNMVVWMLSFLIDHFVKSDWFYLIYGLLPVLLVNAAVLVSIFYKAYAQRDQLIRFKRIRNKFIFTCLMSVGLMVILIFQILIHNGSL